MRKLIAFAFLTLAFSLVAVGQSFSSGSTGADGALDLTSGDIKVPLPASGILNYTTINIPAGRTLTFQQNSSNTGVVLLAQGAVNISGTIDVSASGRNAGPGGFRGGDPDLPGFGPGAGTPSGNLSGQWVGALSLVPIVGGSGGAGLHVLCNGFHYAYGGGGGGAIVIASSAMITVASTGIVLARGAMFQEIPNGFFSCGWPTAQGADGAIRLVGNSLAVSGYLTASVLRLEAPLNAISYNGTGTVPVRSTVNPIIAPSHPPSVSFSSIGGYQVPSSSGSTFAAIDLLLPTQLQDPIPIVIKASNIPPGSPVTISYSGPGSPTFTASTLSGTSTLSSATLYASGLSRTGMTFLFVLATFDPALISLNLKQTGPNAVAKVELASELGGATTYRFLRRDGSEVDRQNVSAELLRRLGL